MIRLVLETLGALSDQKRRCYRRIGSVLVEHTVQDVIPALRKNLEGLIQVIKEMEDQRKKLDGQLTEIATFINQSAAKGAASASASAPTPAPPPRSRTG